MKIGEKTAFVGKGCENDKDHPAVVAVTMLAEQYIEPSLKLIMDNVRAVFPYLPNAALVIFAEDGRAPLIISNGPAQADTDALISALDKAKTAMEMAKSKS